MTLNAKLRQMTVYNKNLIFDLGAHEGEDTQYYLSRGFNVVAVEANPALAMKLREKFYQKISEDRLVIVEAAISDAETDYVTFYENKSSSVWGTVVKSFDDRNHSLGTSSKEIQVPTIKMKQLFQNYGVPYYIKIDIEGMDLHALKQMADEKYKPKYISIESEKVHFSKLVQEFEVLEALGYSSFQLVQQATVYKQKIPQNSHEGLRIEYKFQRGSSGMFGSDLPGIWLSKQNALQRYRIVFSLYKLIGDASLLRRIPFMNFCLRGAQRVIGIGLPGWYDTHATLEPKHETHLESNRT